jgi:hypothetical protein
MFVSFKHERFFSGSIIPPNFTYTVPSHVMREICELKFWLIFNIDGSSALIERLD